MTPSATQVIRKNQQFQTKAGWLDSYHSFSFAHHYDPKNTHHGLLLVSNDDIIQPGTGFDTHPHRDMEIITWVLEGELEHKDSTGNHDVIYPGLAQRMSAGTGIWHSEKNPSASKAVRLIQMWVPPDTPRIDPGYQQLDISPQLNKGGLVALASGKGLESAISIRQKDATLWVGKLKANETVRVPDAPYVHLYVARGEVSLENAGALKEGDAARLTGAGNPTLTVTSPNGAEVLIWEMANALR